MDHFNIRDGVLYAEDCDCRELAERYGTPCYVYSKATLEHHFRVFRQAFAARNHVICYAVKANSNLAVLQILHALGSGFDIVSAGELERVLAIGGDPSKVVFSGVAKTAAEMRYALEQGIRCFNVESQQELVLLNNVASSLNRKAPIAIRVNPDVDADTHPYISTGLRENKFGIDIREAPDIYRAAAACPFIDVKGVACHIGSQLTRIEPFQDALRRVLLLVESLKQEGIDIDEIDIGGGLGIPYRDEAPPAPAQYAQAIFEVLPANYEIFLEPGRAIAGNAGILLTRVQYIKATAEKNFAIVDAGMNDLIRPALYQAWQQILPVIGAEQPEREYDVVGPVCETGDFLGKQRTMAIEQGSLLAVRSSGAYSFVMSSNYNSRGRAAEVVVDGDRSYLVRRREQIGELLQWESLIPPENV